MAHEIGHALQIGDGPGGIYFPDHTDPYFGSGEEVHDFDEWINLSGWKAYDRARISPGERPGTVKVDGVELPLATPVELDGCRVILQYNPGWNLLTSYNADADFSSRWYAKTSPWEDFAEAFSEYLYLPERLINDAPHKFKHLEQEFKRYEDNRELEQQLQRSLARKRMLESGSAESSSIASNLQNDFWVI